VTGRRDGGRFEPGRSAARLPETGLLETLAARWRRRLRGAAALRALAAALPLAAAAWAARRAGWAAPAAVAAVAALAAAAWTWWRWRPGPAGLRAIARHLDRTVPELGDSAELLLAAPAELPLVARLQRQRAVAVLEAAAGAAGLPPRPLLAGARWLALAVALATSIPWLASAAGRASTGARRASPPRVESRSDGENTAPGIVAVRATVVPPAYTGRPERRLEARALEALEVTAEEGSDVTWEFELAGSVETAALVFDESERLDLALSGAAGDLTVARGGRVADAGHLVRLELVGADGTTLRTPYARLSVIADRPPELTIRSPAPFVELERQPGQHVDVTVDAKDDYGVGPVHLVATVASGLGELVEFRERRLAFERRLPLPSQAGQGARLTTRLDLDALGVTPGIELYFYAVGEDGRRPRPQVARSATHIVRMPGDGAQSVGLASRLPVLRVPEFFRSQRQIILDTEKLLADEPSLTPQEVVRRSESLGFDQRALRMRYGALLGEEFESGAPAGADGESDEHEAETRRLDEMDPGRRDGAIEGAVGGLPEGLVHQHDSAEIATYFDSGIKAQLKAALAEMWGAEGALRAIAPRRALPYEYRALTLLKEVQQRSRLYVQKVGFEPPPLYPDQKRLSGELDDVRTVRRLAPPPIEPPLPEVRLALAALEAPTTVPPAAALESARAASRRLAERARLDPALDLAGLEALRGWITTLESGGAPSTAVRDGARAALWTLLPEPEIGPARTLAARTELEEDYRRRLAAGSSP
jgi:hypothetical protein